MDPDIQKYFDFKYVEGELHIFIKREFVKELGWTDKDIELSFGNIKRMNSFKGASLTISKIENNHCGESQASPRVPKRISKGSETGRP